MHRICVIILLLMGTAAPLQSAGGLVAHWRLDTIAGGTTPDSASTHTLTLVNGGTAAPGASDGAIRLDGADDYLETPDAADLDFGAGSFTIALWVRPGATSAARLINKWDGPAQQGWMMDIHSAASGTATAGSVRMRIDCNSASDASADNVDFAVAAGLDSGNWRHLAATIDRATGQVRIFMDGAQVGGAATIPAGFTSVSNDFTAAVGTIPSSQAKFLNGSVDDVRLYSRALSAPEIHALYSGGFVAIGVGNPGPVVPQRGLLGVYYNTTTALATAPHPASPTSPIAPQDANSTLILRRIDAGVNSDLVADRPAGVNDDNFFAEWTGFITTDVAGDYAITMRVDDGGRLWFNQAPPTTTPNVADGWTTQPPADYTFLAAGLAAQTRYPVRFEFFEAGVTQFAGLLWTTPGGPSKVAIPAVHLQPPDGPAAPTGLTAAAASNSPTPQIAVTWNPSAGATSYILSRSTSPGGPYTQVAVQTGTTFNDPATTFGATYHYIVQGTAETGLLVGPPSAETPGATPSQPALSVSPASGLVTSEAGLNSSFTIRVNVSPAGTPASVQITSGAPGEALVSGAGQGPGSPLTIAIPVGTPIGTTIDITVHGQNDLVADGAQPFAITFAVSGGGPGYAGLTMPPVTGSNSDNDTPGITVTPLTGSTTESGGTATFTVTFNTQPSVATTMTVASTNPAEGTVGPTTLTFAPAPFPAADAWNDAHLVTVTGADDAVLDFTQNYAVTLSVSGGDPVYVAMAPITLPAVNLDDEQIPELPTVWGGGGKGCGLTGLEVALALGAAAWIRRRRML